MFYYVNKKKFFKLLANFNELKKDKKSLQKEDPEAFKILLKFLVIIEGNLHYSEKCEYINLVKNFLNNQITADDFSRSFMAIHERISKKLHQMRNKESIELTNFLNKTNRCELNKLFTRTYGSCDSFNLDSNLYMADEEELKNCAQILSLKLEEK